MYAIVKISGKQFKASEGMKVRVPKQNGEQGSSLTFNELLVEYLTCTESTLVFIKFLDECVHKRHYVENHSLCSLFKCINNV